MKFIDFNGLQYFYKKIKQMFVTLNSSGKVPYKQLPDKVKKVKYIRKERRNFFHKSIPISFFVDNDGNYNPQINGKYYDVYFSKCPVFKIKTGVKFKMFLCTINDTPIVYNQLKITDLVGWQQNKYIVEGKIEESENALICNSEDKYTNIRFYSEQSFTNSEIFGYHIDKVIYENDIFHIYVRRVNFSYDKPYNKNLKWIGTRIEYILPTSIKDVSFLISEISDTSYHKLFISNYRNRMFHNKVSIKYLRKYIKGKYDSTGGIYTYRYTKLLLNDKSEIHKIKSRINVIRTTYKHYRKQPSKFHILCTVRKYYEENVIKRVE